jgi:L-alanine-DL-glutamate epimerase-like enolase superfamily enzyme
MLEEATLRRLSLPLGRALISGIHHFRSLETIVLDLRAEDFHGTGYAYTFRPREAEALGALIADLAESVLGADVHPIRAHWRALHQRINYIGQSGLAVMALAAVDTALWDIAAQQARLPLHRMLGAVADQVPVYLSGGWLSYPVGELLADVSTAKEQGFRHYKMKVGNADWRVDIARVEKVVAAAGDAVKIMVDANQAWDADTAIRAGRALQSLGVDWLEEPVPARDLAGHARVSAALDLRVATGETLFTRTEFRPFVEARAAGVLMPDVQRCGGPTEFMNVAVLADSFGIPVSSHLFTEVSAHLIAAAPNGTLVEYIPGWFDSLFSPPLRLADGNLRLPITPGLGFVPDDRALADHAVADPVVLRPLP